MTVFISYRREDSQSATYRLHENLEKNCKKHHFYIDLESIEPGDEFPKSIEDGITKSNLVLIIIGNKYTKLNGSNGQSRLFDENDWVRKEILLAKELNKPIIPILVEGAQMPEEENLPSSLRFICNYNAIHLRNIGYTHDLKKIISTINKINKSGKKINIISTFFTAFFALLVILSIFLLSMDFLSFKEAVKEGSTPSFSNYLKEYPRGVFRYRVQDSLLTEIVKITDTWIATDGLDTSIWKITRHPRVINSFQNGLLQNKYEWELQESFTSNSTLEVSNSNNTYTNRYIINIKEDSLQLHLDTFPNFFYSFKRKKLTSNK